MHRRRSPVEPGRAAMQSLPHSRSPSVTSTSSADPSFRPTKTTSGAETPRKQHSKYSIQAGVSLAHHGPDTTPPTPPGLKGKTKSERESLLPQIPRITGLPARSLRNSRAFHAGQIDLTDPPDGIPYLVTSPSNHYSVITIRPSHSSRNLSVLASPSTPDVSATSYTCSPGTPSSILGKVAYYDSIGHNATPRPQMRPEGLSRRRSALLVDFRSFEQNERTQSPDTVESSSHAASRSVSPDKDLGLLSPPQSSRLPSSSTLPSLCAVQADSPRRSPRPQAIISPASSRAPRYNRSHTVQGNSVFKRKPGYSHAHYSSSSSTSSFGMPVLTSALAGSPGLSPPRNSSPPTTQALSLSPQPTASSLPQISRATSPTISSSLKVRERVSSLSPTSKPWKGARSAGRSPRGSYFANLNGSPSFGSLDGAVGKAVHKFSSFSPRSTPTGKPRGLLEGLFSPARDDDTPRNNGTASDLTQQTKETSGANKENVVPRGLGLGLGGQGDIVTPTREGTYGLKLGKEECLQLGIELRRIMEGDQECLGLLKSCVAKFDRGQMQKERLFARVEELLQRSCADSEVRARLLDRLVNVVDTELAQD